MMTRPLWCLVLTTIMVVDGFVPSFAPSSSSSFSFRRRASSSSSSSSSGEEWWRSFEVEDGELPLSVRDDFPILHKPDLVYLDSAATSQKPRAVTDAITRYYERSNSNVHRGAHSLSREATEAYEAARDKVARLVNARSRNEIVFTSGATEALNLVAATLGSSLREGDEIILSVAEHHSNIVPWQMLRETRGVVLKYLPLTEDGTRLDFARLPELVTDRTALLSLQHASNVLGCAWPIEKVIADFRARAPANARVVVDACQSVPHQPVDVRTLGADLLAASGHKMCGPTGIGFLWGREDLLNALPPYMGGGEMILEVSLEGSTYAPAPGRFEAGTPPIAQAVGLGAACDYLSDRVEGGMERIRRYETAVGTYLRRRLEETDGVEVLGPRVADVGHDDDDGLELSATVAFVCPEVHPSDLGTFLDAEGVAVRAGHHCCQPLHAELGISHSARASLYFYNTKEEVDVFVEKLTETIAFFRSVSGAGAGAGDVNGEDFVVKDDDIFV